MLEALHAGIERKRGGTYSGCPHEPACHLTKEEDGRARSLCNSVYKDTETRNSRRDYKDTIILLSTENVSSASRHDIVMRNAEKEREGNY
jgi:hypothetical protein